MACGNKWANCDSWHHGKQHEVSKWTHSCHAVADFQDLAFNAWHGRRSSTLALVVMPRFHSRTGTQNSMLTGKTTGRDQYSAIYGAQLEAEAKWLAIGAVEKVNSIERLVLPRISRPKRIVELGAGTGAIIAELQRRNFADVYVAVDYSPDATEYMKRNLTNVEVVRADIVEEPIYGAFDVVVVSHVLEHLASPDNFLAALVRNIDFRFAVIECPLEDLAASRLKNLFRNRDENRA